MPSINGIPLEQSTPTTSPIGQKAIALAQENIDSDAMNALSPTQQHGLARITSINPLIAQNPSTIASLARMDNASPTQISNAVKYLTAYNQIGRYVHGYANNDGGWGHFTNDVSGMWSNAWRGASNFLQGAPSGLWDAATNVVKDGYNVLNDSVQETAASEAQYGFWGSIGNNIMDKVSGVGQGLGGLADWGKNIALRGMLTTDEIATIGFFGPNGFQGNPLVGLGDAYNTANNVALSVTRLIDPWSQQNAYQLMSHTMAFTESLAAQRGWNYALSYMLPSILAGLATDGASTDASVAAANAEALQASIQMAEDSRLVAMGNAAKAAGKTLDEETQAAIKAAEQRSTQAIVERLKIGAERELQSGKFAGTDRGTAYKLADLASQAAFRPLGYLMKTARLAGKATSSVRLNAMYLVNQENVLNSNDQPLIDLWNKTRDGNAYDANGKIIGTDGQMLAQYFGIDKGNPFFAPVSGLTDFYTKWLGTDPLGAYGKVLHTSRSFAGFTGTLGAWFSGLGIRNADDVDLAYQQYARVRNAVHYIASHSASEILDTFRNTFQDSADKSVKAGTLIKRLGEANTEEGVLAVFRDIAEGSSIVNGMMPSMSMYEIFKAELKGDLGRRFHILGNLLNSDGAFIQSVWKVIREETGVDIKPNSALLFALPDESIRGTAAFFRWLATRFTRDSSYIDELTGKIENKIIRPGSVNAIPAIMDLLRSSLMHEDAVKAVGDLLLHAEGPQEYINAYRQAMYYATMRRAVAGLEKGELGILTHTMGNKIWEEVMKLTGLDGGGDRGLYVAGKEGRVLSRVGNSKTGLEGFAGIGSTHLGELRIPRAAELRGLAKEMRRISGVLYTTLAGKEIEPRLLSLEQKLRLAEYARVSRDGVVENATKPYIKERHIYANVKAEDRYDFTDYPEELKQQILDLENFNGEVDHYPSEPEIGNPFAAEKHDDFVEEAKQQATRLREASENYKRELTLKQIELEENGFKGEFRFLSNFHESPVVFEGKTYPTVEHAFQAAKTTDKDLREQIRNANHPNAARRLGRKNPLREDWNLIREDVMKNLVRQKFSEPGMRDLLLQTGDAKLVEVNTWHDNTWGDCSCGKCAGIPGQNKLGQLLTDIRSEFQKALTPEERAQYPSGDSPKTRGQKFKEAISVKGVFNKKDAPEDAIYVGRGTPWGNPFKIGPDGTREEVIEKFYEYAKKRLAEEPDWLDPLKGKNISCNCSPLACHGDVIKHLIDESIRNKQKSYGIGLGFKAGYVTKPGLAVPKDSVFVGEGSKWANPFKVGPDGSAKEVAEKFREYVKERLADDPTWLNKLQGKNAYVNDTPADVAHAYLLHEIVNEHFAAEFKKITQKTVVNGTSETLDQMVSALERFNAQRRFGDLPSNIVVARDEIGGMVGVLNYVAERDGSFTIHNLGAKNKEARAALLQALHAIAGEKDAPAITMSEGGARKLGEPENMIIDHNREDIEKWTTEPPLKKGKFIDGYEEAEAELSKILKTGLSPMYEFGASESMPEPSEVEHFVHAANVFEAKLRFLFQQKREIEDRIAAFNNTRIFSSRVITAHSGFDLNVSSPQFLMDELEKVRGKISATNQFINSMQSPLASPVYGLRELAGLAEDLKEARWNVGSLSEVLRKGYMPKGMKRDFIVTPPKIDSFIRARQDTSPEGERLIKDLVETHKDLVEKADLEKLRETFKSSSPEEMAAIEKFFAEKTDNYEKELLDFVNRIGPKFFAGVIAMVGSDHPDAFASYMFGQKILNIYSAALEAPLNFDFSVYHELFHHLSTYLPEEYVAQMENDFDRAREKFFQEHPLWDYMNKDTEDGVPLGWVHSHGEEMDYINHILDVNGTNPIDPKTIDFTRLSGYTMSAYGRNYWLHGVDEFFAESLAVRTMDLLSPIVSEAGKENLMINFGHSVIASVLSGMKNKLSSELLDNVFDNFMESRYLGNSEDLPLGIRSANIDRKNFQEILAEKPETNLQTELARLYSKRSPYIMGWQYTVDAINRFLSRTFVPMALFSGGWALRVGASEAMLNSLRFGGWQSFDAKVMASIAKHEAYGARLFREKADEVAARLAKQGLDPQKMSVEEFNSYVRDAYEGKLIRDVVAGVLTGMQKNLILGMDQAKRNRMLDDFVGTIMRHDGHLPGGVHSSKNDVFDEKTVEQTMSGILLEKNDNGEWVPSTKHGRNGVALSMPGAPNYESDLRMQIARIANDPLLAPVSKEMEEWLYNYGLQQAVVHGAITDPKDEFGFTREEIIRQGVKYIGPTEVDALRAAMEKKALETIEALPPEEVSRFQRDTGRIPPTSKFARSNAHEEWAAVIAENAIASVSGSGYFEDNNGTLQYVDHYFHPALVTQAANPDKLKGLEDFREDVRKMGNLAPEDIPSIGGHSGLVEGSMSDLITRVAEKGHDAVLGPIVNKMVREPIFLLEQHLQMERLRPLIERNLIDEPTAHMIADRDAFINMHKYVHNPQDKTLWEVNMRVLAPFYFAQNQAWRRAFRVLRNDPGAFERYLKLCLGVTNYISNASAGGNNPSIAVPGSTFLGNAGVIGGNVGSFTNGAFGHLGFGLSIDPGSIASVVPTGSESGAAGALGLFRPSWGPLVTMPLKIAEKMFSGATSSGVLATKVLAAILGPVSNNSSLYSDFFPSTIGRNLLDASVALANAAGITDLNTSAMRSTENLVLNNALDNLYSQQYDLAWKHYQKALEQTNPNTGQPWTPNEKIAFLRAQADLYVSDYFNNPQNFQTFLDHARGAAVMMMLVKGVLAFASPAALSIQEQFSKSPEFQALSARMPFTEAANKFAVEYPNNIFDLVAHSSSNYTPYPETVSSAAILSTVQGQQLAAKYPYAFAYTISRNGKYSPVAYTLEVSLNLRAKDTPQQYLDAILVAAGNDYYYNYLAAQPAFGGNGMAPGTNIGYQEYKALNDQALNYGRSMNPTWLSNFQGASRYNAEINSINEMRSLVKDPLVTENIMTKTDRKKFAFVLENYDSVVSKVQAIISGNGSATGLENQWYNWCQEVAADPQFKTQAYFIQHALASLPNKYGN